MKICYDEKEGKNKQTIKQINKVNILSYFFQILQWKYATMKRRTKKNKKQKTLLMKPNLKILKK